MHGLRPFRAYAVFQPVQYIGIILLGFYRPKTTAVEMSEIYGGPDALIHVAEGYYLIEVAQLVYLPHSLGAEGDIHELHLVQCSYYLLKEAAGPLQYLPPVAA